MQTEIRCLVAEDEPLARKGMEKFIADVPFLKWVGSCSNAMQVLETLERQEVDLLFLDIQMPKLTGLELLRNCRTLPLTVITTAFPDYALEGYELDVLDYLVKPIPFDRFLKAANKAKDFLSVRSTRSLADAAIFFFVKCDNRYEKVFYDDVLYVQAMHNYVIVQTATKRLVSYLTMKSVEDQLPVDRFVRISKSHIVSVAKITSISGQNVLIGAQAFPIGRQMREQVMEQLLANRLLKRK